MAIKFKYGEWFKAGAVLGLFISIFLPIVNNLVGSAEYGITFSVVSIRQQLSQFATSGSAFSEWLLSFTQFSFNVPQILMTMVGTGLLVLAARHIIGLVGLPKNAKHKVIAVYSLASVFLGLIFAGGIQQAVGQFNLSFVFAAAVTGFALAFLVEMLYKNVLKWTLPN